MKKLSVLFLAILSTILSASAGKYIVTDSSGLCPTNSLCWAVGQANSNLGPDTILFNLPIDQRIIDMTAILTISDTGTFINGDIDDDGKPDIRVSRNSGIVDVFSITTPFHTIKGLAIDNANYPILINNTSNINIVSCYFGLDLTGSIMSPCTGGIYITNSKLVNIGDGTIKGRNVFAGFSGSALRIYKSDSISIVGNYIGVMADGSTPSNMGIGIDIENGSSYLKIGEPLVGFSNVISGHQNSGIMIRDSCNNIQIVNNHIGTDATGTFAVGNSMGIQIIDNANNIKIGLPVPNGGNVISGNTTVGIDITQDLSNRPRNIDITNNYVGLAKDGNSPIPNLSSGLRIQGGNRDIRIGNGTALGRNIVSGNGGIGVQFSAGSVDTIRKVSILGNYIGTDLTGNLDRGNSNDGIYILGSGSAIIDSILIGDGSIGGKNVIAGNQNGINIAGINVGAVFVNNNIIGASASGLKPIGNAGVGIVIASGTSFNKTENNIVAYNGIGIQVFNAGNENTIFNNLIYGNSSTGVSISNSNTNILPPQIITFGNDSILSGNARPYSLIQIYADKLDGGQGKLFIDTISANALGAWQYKVQNPPYGMEFTALQDSAGNTSAFSLPYVGYVLSGTAFNGTISDTLSTGKAFLFLNQPGIINKFKFVDTFRIGTGGFPPDKYFLRAFPGEYLLYVVPNKTANPTTLATYYNNTTRWFKAMPIKVSNDTTINVMMQNPLPLTGLGNLKGRVEQGVNSNFNKVQGPGDPFNGIDVSLIDKSTGSAIAFTQTDNDTTPGVGGVFEFENVPLGIDYLIHVDVAGIPIDTNTVYNISTSTNDTIDNILVKTDSNYIYFTTETGIQTAIKKVDLEFNIYPNPFAEEAFINYQVEKAQYIQIVLYDILGNKVSTLLAQKHSAGRYVYMINRKNLNIESGNYFIKMISDTKEISRKFIIID